jgi:phage terminase large subunit-like protein
MWHRSAFGPVPKDVGKLVFAIDRTPSWEFATITANAKGDDGTIYTQVVASIRKPNLEWLVNLCKDLNKHSPYKFVMDGYNLKDLGKELQNSGLPVEVFRSANDTANACTTTYALIATGKVRHNNDALLAQQMPFAVKKNVGESWRISRPDSSVSIDAVMATVYGIYAADKYQDVPMQIFG